MATIQSSQEFIRALKAPSDPPVAGGSSKIEIARQAWDNSAFYLPSKAEVIVDWLLSSLLRDKSQLKSTFNLNYWRLLLDVLSDKNTTNTRPIKTWLTPLLLRIPLQPILSAFVTNFKSPAELADVASSCVSILWPISVQKMSLENLADLFKLLLQKVDTGVSVYGIINIAVLVSSSYRASLGNFANKKKFYLLFLQSFLPTWLRVMGSQSHPSTDSTELGPFYENVYEAGADTLFNLDILRQLSENRPTDHSTTFLEHLRKARSSPSEAQYVLSVVPRIFSSYVQALKRCRGAVFSQSSSINDPATLNNELNAASMRFFANCEAVISDVGTQGVESTRDAGIWDARLMLLGTVFDEKLFSIQQDDATSVLSTLVEDAIGVLAHSWQDEWKDVISSTVKCLHQIGQTDCDLLLPSLPRVLPLLLPISSIDPASALFLDLILDYHTKTRTLNVHVHNLLASFAPDSFPPSSTTNIHDVYELCFSGHILSNRHLKKLGNAMQTFLTPGQTLKCVEDVIETLKISWQSFLDNAEGKDDEGTPKKKKGRESSIALLDPNSEPRSTSITPLAVSFSLRAYLVLSVLSNLPMPNLTEETTTNIQALISHFRRQYVQKGLEKLLKTKRLLPGNEKKKRKRGSEGGRDFWSMQIVTAAMLRIDYALHAARSLGLGVQENANMAVERAKEVIAKEGGKGNLIAELELEIFRKLLWHISSHNTQQEEALQIFDYILSYLNSTFKPSGPAWSGLLCLLKTRELGALAVLHLILERWLPFLDHLASPSQLTNLVQLILSININPVPSSMDRNLRPEHLLLRLLHSAEFWEMQNLRSAFLSCLIQITSLSNVQVQADEYAAYNLLLYVPTEYFTKTARTHFVRRAYTADTQLGEAFAKNQSVEQQKTTLRTLVTLRVFLKRLIELKGFERVPDVDLSDFVVHLLSFDHQVEGSERDAFVQSTLDLTGVCFSELLKNVNLHSDALFKVIASFNQYPVFEMSESSARSLRSRNIANLVGEVIKLKDTTSLPLDCVNLLRGFHGHLSRTISRIIRDIKTSRLNQCLDLLVGWRCALGLQKWLGESEKQTDKDSDLGKLLVSAAMKMDGNDKKLNDIQVSIFAILRAELSLMSEVGDRQGQLNLLVVTFIVFYDGCANTARRELDNHMLMISKYLTPDDYSHTLDLVSESLILGSLAETKLKIVVHLTTLLLRGHPQHTLKHVQNFSTQCLNTFLGSKVFTSGDIALRLLTLELIVQHCSERPATLRSIDIGNIFTILFKFLQPSEDRDKKTTPEIFHKIVASISALVRLRRDLVTSALPHLGLILRNLFSVIRSCRPQLGSKQTAIVMRTQPRWIVAKQPLGSEEGRMLCRVLETLNVKTTIRNYTSNEVQKAESLSKPFSKHAAYVLTAYIETLNDPLCLLGIEMRRELDPGIFALCEIMGEHARDALVVSLDTGGKAALKLIWKEYEKQRYIGQG